MRTVFLMYLIFAFGIYAAAQCHAPRYHAVRSLNTSDGNLRISIEPRDFTVANLICLVQTLKQRHSKWKSVILEIFDSQYAAQIYTDPGSETPSMGHMPAVQPHAIYALDSDKNEETLFLYPFGGLFDRESDSTKIDFPVSGTPRCRLAIHDRCLMIAVPAEYPYAALKDFTSGRVTLEGTITSEGKVAGIQVQNVDVDRGADGKLLVEGAKQNLATWQLEPRRGQEGLRITYSYILDRSLGQYPMDMEFRLPDQILIKGNPAALTAPPYNK